MTPAMSESWASPKIAQLALCTSDLPQTVRLYTEVFGFAGAGGLMIWGEWLAHIQGLGDDAASSLWWLVGRQELLQIELFTHTLPRQRPLSADWGPSDLGWTRWGLAVPDFEPALARLKAFGISTITEPVVYAGLRRVCFRDPGTAVIVEVMEDGAALPGGTRPRYYELAPAVVYATLSVPDLDRARTFFIDTVGLTDDDAVLHTPDLEALWGLPGASRETFVARGGDIYLEVVRYDDPVGRPRPADHRLSDQGFMNIAVGSRRRSESLAILDKLAAAGYEINAELPGPTAGGTYLTDADGNSLEVICAPREFDSAFGFAPQPALLRPAAWPQADVDSA